MSTKQATTSRVKMRQTYLAEGAVPASEHQAGHYQKGEEEANRNSHHQEQVLLK